MDEKKNILKDMRSYFIGDRVVLTQSIALLGTAFISFLIESFNISIPILSLWWLFLLIIPIALILILALKFKSFYFDNHWIVSFWFVLGIWLSVTVYLGVLLDMVFNPKYSTFWACLVVLLTYGAGYLIARLVRKKRRSIERGKLITISILGCVGLIVSTMIIGGFLYAFALEINNIDFTDIFAIHSCQDCISSIYLILIGIGVSASFGLHYFMLKCLYGEKGLDVIADPPNELYLKIIRNSMILTFISWILLLVLFPPIAGGGKKSSSGSSKSSRRYHSRYGRVYGYGKKPSEDYPPDEVEKEWDEYRLAE